MADYKKRKVKHKPLHSKRPQKNKIHSENIEMRSFSSNKTPEKKMKVVKGKKLERRHKFKVFISSVAVICLSAFILTLTLPVDIFENITNAVMLIGSGSYPSELYGFETLDSVSKNDYYYILTDTNLNAFTNGGKRIFSHPHGFENPVLSTCETRALVFDQGGNSLYVYNLKNRVNTFESDNSIINASVSRNGHFAVSVKSNNYASTVFVFNKHQEKIYTWNSAKEIINNVLVSPDGKKLALTTLNVSGGKYISKLHVFSFNSADPIFSLDFEEQPSYKLVNTDLRHFALLNSSGMFVFSWKNYSKSEVKSDYFLDNFRFDKRGSLLVFNRNSDKSDNTVMIVSSKGEKVSEFHFKGIITDIEYKRDNVYLISDTKSYILDKTGNIIRKGDCSYGCVRFAVVGAHSLAVITDNNVNKIDISKEVSKND